MRLLTCSVVRFGFCLGSIVQMERGVKRGATQNLRFPGIYNSQLTREGKFPSLMPMNEDQDG